MGSGCLEDLLFGRKKRNNKFEFNIFGNSYGLGWFNAGKGVLKAFKA